MARPRARSNCPPLAGAAAADATASVQMPLDERLQLVAAVGAPDASQRVVVGVVRWLSRANRLPATGRIRIAESVIRHGHKRGVGTGKGEGGRPKTLITTMPSTKRIHVRLNKQANTNEINNKMTNPPRPPPPVGWVGDGLIKSNNDFHTTTQNATVQLFTYRYRYRLWATSTSEVKCDAEVAPFLFSFLVLVFLCVDAAPPRWHYLWQRLPGA